MLKLFVEYLAFAATCSLPLAAASGGGLASFSGTT
jgi:hypothetical protein